MESCDRNCSAVVAVVEGFEGEVGLVAEEVAVVDNYIETLEDFAVEVLGFEDVEGVECDGMEEVGLEKVCRQEVAEETDVGVECSCTEEVD